MAQILPLPCGVFQRGKPRAILPREQRAPHIKGLITVGTLDTVNGGFVTQEASSQLFLLLQEPLLARRGRILAQQTNLAIDPVRRKAVKTYVNTRLVLVLTAGWSLTDDSDLCT